MTRDQEADQLLASLTVAQLEAGLEKARCELAILDAIEAQEDRWDGPFPPSGAYDRWSVADLARRRKGYAIAAHDVRQELARRAQPQPGDPNVKR